MIKKLNYFSIRVDVACLVISSEYVKEYAGLLKHQVFVSFEDI